MRHANGQPFTVRDRLLDLAERAREAASRKDWKLNHALCSERDELALSAGVQRATALKERKRG